MFPWKAPPVEIPIEIWPNLSQSHRNKNPLKKDFDRKHSLKMNIQRAYDRMHFRYEADRQTTNQNNNNFMNVQLHSRLNSLKRLTTEAGKQSKQSDKPQ